MSEQKSWEDDSHKTFYENVPDYRHGYDVAKEELDRLREEHAMMKEAILEILNECECTELCTCSYTNKVTARECLAKLGE